MSLFKRLENVEALVSGRKAAETRAVLDVFYEWTDANWTPSENESFTRVLIGGHEPFTDSDLAGSTLTRAESDAILAGIPVPSVDDFAAVDAAFECVPASITGRMSWLHPPL